MNQIYTAPLLTSWPTLISLRQIISWIKGEDKKKKRAGKKISYFETTITYSTI